VYISFARNCSAESSRITLVFGTYATLKKLLSSILIVCAWVIIAGLEAFLWPPVPISGFISIGFGVNYLAIHCISYSVASGVLTYQDVFLVYSIDRRLLGEGSSINSINFFQSLEWGSSCRKISSRTITYYLWIHCNRLQFRLCFYQRTDSCRRIIGTMLHLQQTGGLCQRCKHHILLLVLSNVDYP
jgi:hypothetical protein